MDSTDVAIIGMSCRVAGAKSPAQLFENLASSKDVRREIDRFNSVGYYKPSGGPRKGLTNVRHAYLLDGGINRFDNEFFAIPAIEAEAIDPQQRLLLELAYEAIESAGIPLEKIQGTDTAVYTGTSLICQICSKVLRSLTSEQVLLLTLRRTCNLQSHGSEPSATSSALQLKTRGALDPDM